MENLILIVHILASLGVIGLVLVQHGKGADAGAAFGGGNSGSVFGVQGSANFLSRATSICVTTFFCTRIALAVIASNRHGDNSVVDLKDTQIETNVSSDTDQDIEKPLSAQDIPN